MVAPSFLNNNNLQRQQAPLGFQHPLQDRMASMENKLHKFLDAITNKLSSHEENQKRMEAKFDQIAKNHSSSIHNIEVQLGQLANVVGSKTQGNLPSTTESNPRKLKAITLRSGKEVKSQAKISKEAEEKEDDQYVMVEDVPKEKQVQDPTEPKKASNSTPLTYAPKIPFPQRLKKHKDKEQFSKFLEIFKKL